MKVKVDSGICQGHGQCVIVCPAVFHADEQGFAVLVQEEVPADEEANAERAEVMCPERAIQIER